MLFSQWRSFSKRSTSVLLQCVVFPVVSIVQKNGLEEPEEPEERSTGPRAVVLSHSPGVATFVADLRPAACDPWEIKSN